MPSRPSLHQSLYDCIQSTATDHQKPRTFGLTTLCTKPFRTHTLFPHALDPTIATIRTDYLIMLAESFEDYRTEDPQSLPRPQVTVPVFALEASLFTIPSTGVQILYISKIDTTGLSPSPAPAGQLTSAFLSHFLQYKPRSIWSLRIHIFARAAREGQYLFPASAENAPNGPGDGAKLCSKLASSTQDATNISSPNRPRAGKRILNDQQLVKWWHQTLSKVASEFRASQSQKNLECFYILPGFDEQESYEVLPVWSKQVKEIWSYGHPYKHVPTPLSKPKVNGEDAHPVLLSELIPAFNDDPKARFLHSIGDCSTNPSGEPGDWDDAIVDRPVSSLENDRSRERAKINQISADEFWDRMGGRQECCDGRVSAFFVLVSSDSHPKAASILTDGQLKRDAEAMVTAHEDPGSTPSNSGVITCTNDSNVREEAPRKELVGILRNVWISLWSKIHNKDYAKLETASVGYLSWIQDVKSSINSTIVEDQRKKKKINGVKDKTENEEISKKGVDTVGDHQDDDTRKDKGEASSLSLDNCHSVIVVNNYTLQKQSHTSLEQNEAYPSKPCNLFVDQQRPTQVNVLQPRKKIKK